MAKRAQSKVERAELDELTLGRARGGDPEAFRVLVDRYQRTVWSLLFRMIEPSFGTARVEELAQETFLRVFRALGRFRPGGPARLSSWILTIATRLALNELRKSGREEPLDQDHVALCAEPGADADLDRRRLGQAIGRAIAFLPAEQRAVLVLREYHELSYEELAEALGLEVGTVKSRLSRARSAVREALREVHDG